MKNPAASRSAKLLLFAALALSLLPLRLLASPAYAEDPYIDPDLVCQIGSGVCPETYAPPSLLGKDAYAAMTPAQATALHTLEDKAIDNTLAGNALPASDRDAVLAWARPEAQGELFALIIEAIKTPQAERSPAQQQAAEWMGALLPLEAEAAANQAGAHYASWAGQDLDDYWQLIRNNAGADQLRAFLSPNPEPYDNPDVSQAKTGYCKFTPPAPYAEEYTARTAQTCYVPCATNYSTLCTPTPPTYAQFVKWGEASATQGVIDSPEYLVNASAIATTLVIPIALAGAGFALVQLSAALTGISLTNTLLVALPRAMTIAQITVVPFSVTSQLSAAGAAFFAAAAAAVVVVIGAVVSAVLEGIRVGEAATLPGKLADLVVGARADVDVAALAETEAGMTTMFSLFVRATLPIARAEYSCDNTDPQIPVACLNQPSLPPPDPADPSFVVEAEQSGFQSVTPTITLDGPGTSVRKVRVHGRWFVHQLEQTDTPAEAPSLSLGYTDWGGKTQLARLLKDSEGGYSFVGFAADSASSMTSETCKAAGTCWKADSIKYLGPDGRRYEAHIERPAAPTGTATFSPSRPVEGQLITFAANSFAPAGSVGSVTYSWQFQAAACLSCSMTAPIYGESVGWLWQTSGNFKATLTAVDSEGRTATTTINVPVAAVPPTLTTDPTDQPVTAGTPTTIRGTVDYAGKLDNVTVKVNWDDGTPATTTGFGPGLIFTATPDLTLTPMRVGSDNTIATLTATHTYTKPGTYQPVITVTNQAGQTDRTVQSLVVEPTS